MNRDQKKEIHLSSQKNQFRIGIVVADFHFDITEKLLEGAKEILLSYGVLEEKITTVHVPGAFEIPLACLRLAKIRYDALIAIGCVIRGDTDHYTFVAGESNRGIMKVMIEQEIPIANCILTLENLKQAHDRCGKKDNKGSEVAVAALLMAGTPKHV